MRCKTEARWPIFLPLAADAEVEYHGVRKRGRGRGKTKHKQEDKKERLVKMEMQHGGSSKQNRGADTHSLSAMRKLT